MVDDFLRRHAFYCIFGVNVQAVFLVETLILSHPNRRVGGRASQSRESNLQSYPRKEKPILPFGKFS